MKQLFVGRKFGRGINPHAEAGANLRREFFSVHIINHVECNKQLMWVLQNTESYRT